MYHLRQYARSLVSAVFGRTRQVREVEAELAATKRTLDEVVAEKWPNQLGPR